MDTECSVCCWHCEAVISGFAQTFSFLSTAFYSSTKPVNELLSRLRFQACCWNFATRSTKYKVRPLCTYIVHRHTLNSFPGFSHPVRFYRANDPSSSCFSPSWFHGLGLEHMPLDFQTVLALWTYLEKQCNHCLMFTGTPQRLLFQGAFTSIVVLDERKTNLHSHWPRNVNEK